MEAKHDKERLPLRERNKQRIIQRIVEAACTLFSTLGYEQTTMDMIAEQAEVSRGTLFNYFPTKTLLLLPFASNLYERLVQPDVLACLETQATTLDVLRFLFLKIDEQVLALPGVLEALQQYEFSPHSSTKMAIGSIGFFDALRTIIRDGQQRAEVRTDIPTEKLARYIGVLYLSLLRALGKDPTRTQSDYRGEVETLLAFLRSALYC